MYTNNNIQKVKTKKSYSIYILEVYNKTKDRTIVPPVIPFENKKKYNRKIKHKLNYKGVML